MIIEACHVQRRHRIHTGVADVVRRAADLEMVDAVRGRRKEQAVAAGPGRAGDRVAFGIAGGKQPAVEVARADGGVDFHAVGPACLQGYFETVAVAGQLDLARCRRAGVETAGFAAGVIVRPDLLHQQFVGAGADSPVADGDVMIAVAPGGKEQAAVEQDPAVIVSGGREQRLPVVVDAEQLRVRQGAGAGRGTFQVDAVGLAGLQADLDPVHVAGGFDLSR